MEAIALQKEDGEDAHLITASLDGRVCILPLNLHEGDDQFTVKSIQMFSVCRGGIAKLDVFMTNSGGIFLLSVDGGGTLQLFQTVQREATKEKPTQFATTRDEELRSKERAKERFPRSQFSAVAVIKEQQSWAAWKLSLEMKEKRRDFESEIVAMEESLTSLKEDVANLMSSNSSLPGERIIMTVGEAIKSTCGLGGEVRRGSKKINFNNVHFSGFWQTIK